MLFFLVLLQANILYAYYTILYLRHRSHDIHNGTYAIYRCTVHTGIVNRGKNRANGAREVSINISKAYFIECAINNGYYAFGARRIVRKIVINSTEDMRTEFPQQAHGPSLNGYPMKYVRQASEDFQNPHSRATT